MEEEEDLAEVFTNIDIADRKKYPGLDLKTRSTLRFKEDLKRQERQVTQDQSLALHYFHLEVTLRNLRKFVRDRGIVHTETWRLSKELLDEHFIRFMSEISLQLDQQHVTLLQSWNSRSDLTDNLKNLLASRAKSQQQLLNKAYLKLESGFRDIQGNLGCVIDIGFGTKSSCSGWSQIDSVTSCGSLDPSRFITQVASLDNSLPIDMCDWHLQRISESNQLSVMAVTESYGSSQARVFVSGALLTEEYNGELSASEHRVMFWVVNDVIRRYNSAQDLIGANLFLRLISGKPVPEKYTWNRDREEIYVGNKNYKVRIAEMYRELGVVFQDVVSRPNVWEMCGKYI